MKTPPSGLFLWSVMRQLSTEFRPFKLTTDELLAGCAAGATSQQISSCWILDRRLTSPKKQIIVTCNYEARRRGLRKMQLISEAKKLVPDVIIVLGEELGRFRDASKALYKFLESFTWSGRVERLGFDEVFMDVTDLVNYNQDLLNHHDLPHSFFQMKRADPTIGFPFDATKIVGHTFPDDPNDPTPPQDALPESCTAVPSHDANDPFLLRLILGSHLAQHLRWTLEEEKGYTSTVGISTNKILSKLAGNLHKPKAQTTLVPPYEVSDGDSNVMRFLDSHDIGKVPGIGFKMAHRIRNHVLAREAEFDAGLIYGGTLESVSIRDVRLSPGMGPELLESILGGPGSERGIGGKAWNLLNGIDDSEVQQARKVPTQISIEDSYKQLDTMPQVLSELRRLATSLVKRMHTDLLEDDDDASAKRWLAHPKTLRLSTRPRPPMNADGTRTRSFNRISRSGPLPNLVFNLKDSIDAVVEKLVQVALIPMFRRLHPQPGGWNLSLMNVAVTNMVEAASEDGKFGGGRDIGNMFKKQEEVLREWKVEDRDVPPEPIAREEVLSTVQGRAAKSAEDDVPPEPLIKGMLNPFNITEQSQVGVPVEPSAGDEAWVATMTGSEDTIIPTQNIVDEWGIGEEDDNLSSPCDLCGAVMPSFAREAHDRFHFLGK